MQTVLEQGSIDKPLTFDVGLIQLSFIPVCSLNTCNISVKLCRGFALQCFSLLIIIVTIFKQAQVQNFCVKLISVLRTYSCARHMMEVHWMRSVGIKGPSSKAIKSTSGITVINNM